MSATYEAFERAVRRLMPLSADPGQKKEVMALYRLLERHRTQQDQYKLVGPEGDVSTIPASILLMVGCLVEFLVRGDAVTVVPVSQELTTQEAGDILNVSRQYLVRLLEGGEIPYTKTGSHRRLRLEDVLAYKARRDQKRLETLNELARASQEFGGYDELS